MSAPEIAASIQFLEFLSELGLLEKPTVACLMDKLIGKRCPSDPEVSGGADVPPSLHPIQNYMLRLVLFGAGETIDHNGRICEVIETHEQLHRLLPLIDEDLSEAKPSPFWVPRHTSDKKEMRDERIRRQYDSGLRVAFGKPSWTGEPRPSGARTVQLRSNFPPAAYLTRLVRKLGYNGRAAFAATTRGHLPQLQIIDRRGWRYSDKSEKFVRDTSVGIHSDHPYIPLAPDRETAVGGGLGKEQVAAAIAKHRWPDAHSSAVYEIVYLRREPRFVAASLGLRLETVYRYCSRIRAELAAGEADLRVKDLKSFICNEPVQDLDIYGKRYQKC